MIRRRDVTLMEQAAAAARSRGRDDLATEYEDLQSRMLDVLEAEMERELEETVEKEM